MKGEATEAKKRDLCRAQLKELREHIEKVSTPLVLEAGDPELLKELDRNRAWLEDLERQLAGAAGRT